VFASKSLGGPDTLAGLRDDPETCALVLREWPRHHVTLRKMRAALLRFMEATIGEETRIADLRLEIERRLIPRPANRLVWHHLPRTVGGHRRVVRKRPVLSVTDLIRLVKAAPIASPTSLSARNQALLSLLCFSAIGPNEVLHIRRRDVTLVDGRTHWCAQVHNIRRRGRIECIWVAEEARPYLVPFLKSLEGKQYLFQSARKRNCPISYPMVHRIIAASSRNAAVPVPDDRTLKMSYAWHLKERGLRDYAIRDAMGLITTGAVLDGLLRPHRRAAAQKKAALNTFPVSQDGPQPENATWRPLFVLADAGDSP
jgi:integrase